MKEKAFIFGSSGTGQRVLSLVKASYDIIGFLDNDNKRWTNGGGEGQYQNILYILQNRSKRLPMMPLLSRH